jgi:hypothetical protein
MRFAKLAKASQPPRLADCAKEPDPAGIPTSGKVESTERTQSDETTQFSETTHALETTQPSKENPYQFTSPTRFPPTSASEGETEASTSYHVRKGETPETDADTALRYA